MFAGGAGGAQALAPAFQQHGELAGDLVVGQHGQGPLGTDDATKGLIDLEPSLDCFGEDRVMPSKAAQGGGVSQIKYGIK